LVFKIESSKLSITPNTAEYPGDNLPVESGSSICTGNESKQSFHYVYTLNYSDYESTAEESTGGKNFYCHFKTNMEDSESTIYVANEYFNKGNAAFTTYSLYDFSNIRFSSYTAGANTNLNCTFVLDSEDNATSRIITVKLDGLTPQSTVSGSGWSIIDSDAGVYTYTFDYASGVGGQTVTLPVKTLREGQHNGTYTVTLNAYEGSTPVYHEGVLDSSVGPVMKEYTVTVTPTNKNSATSGDVTITFAKGSGYDNPGFWYNYGVGLYWGNTATVNVPDGCYITKIVINMHAYYSSELESDTGSISSLSNNTQTWTATSNTDTVVLTSSSGEADCLSFVVTYKKPED